MEWESAVSKFPSFSVLHGKQLSLGVVLASWSPAAMDLLAVVTEDNMLTIYRLDLQRAWVACPDVPITALSWTPDGECLRDGNVLWSSLRPR